LLLLLRALLTGLRSRRDLALENLVLPSAPRRPAHQPQPWPPKSRSSPLGLGSPALAKGLAPTPPCSPARDRAPVASQRMAAVLELEVTHQTRPPSTQPRGEGISSPGSPKRTGSGVPSAFAANCSSWGSSSVTARFADTGGGSRRAAGPRDGGLFSRMSSGASGQPISWSCAPLTQDPVRLLHQSRPP
jgi:hypothetical protein